MPDFKPIIHELQGRTIKVWAVADVHIGSRECDLDGFKKFIGMIFDDPDSYVVIVGDLLDNAVAAGGGTPVSDDVMSPMDALDVAADIMRPVSDRVLAIVSGNHEDRTRKFVGFDIMEHFALMIGRIDAYRHDMAFVRLNMVGGSVYKTGRWSVRGSASILCVHGKSAAKTKKFAYAVEGVDVIITGHTHEGLVSKPARLCFTQKGNVVVKSLVSMTATSWLDYGGYGAASTYLPNATSDPQCVEIGWSNSNSRKGRIRVIW